MITIPEGWTPEKSTRRCPFCKTQTGNLLEDTERQRLYECRACFSVEVITKGEKKTNGWWYHGWEHPDGRRVNGDGKRLTRPDHMKFGWWDRSAQNRERSQ